MPSYLPNVTTRRDGELMRKTLGYLRLKALNIEKLFTRFRWQYIPNSKAGQTKQNAHLLVVKKNVYVEVVKTCIQSYLFWNRGAKVTVHCDETSYAKLIEWKRGSRHSSRIQIIGSYVGDTRNWQEIKLDLLLSLNGSFDFFMDADLRWNGSLVMNTSIPLFFLKEFKLADRAPYKQIIENNLSPKYKNAFMWNTSFFTFSGFNLMNDQIHEVIEIYKSILSIIQSDEIGLDDKPGLIRIAEQLALSIASTSWNTNVGQLKLEGGFKDGSFLESSYFGVTGATF